MVQEIKRWTTFDGEEFDEKEEAEEWESANPLCRHILGHISSCDAKTAKKIAVLLRKNPSSFAHLIRRNNPRCKTELDLKDVMTTDGHAVITTRFNEAGHDRVVSLPTLTNNKEGQ
jgi:hypothetical protein